MSFNIYFDVRMFHCVSRLLTRLVPSFLIKCHFMGIKKVKASHTRYRALGPELIPVYRQSARR